MATGAARTAARRVGEHQSFLRHRDFRWLKIGLGFMLLAIIGFAFIPAAPGPYGGSWFGYTLGTLAALLILWLSLLGIRKRAMTPGRWSLKAWTSAHVWLGLSLIVVATLHTGLRLGWNLATLAWTLMMLVILSGVYGISIYAALPATLSRKEDEQTQPEMVEGLRAIDRQLHDAAQPLPATEAGWVSGAMAQDPFGAGLRQRLSGHVRNCTTLAALDLLDNSQADAGSVARVRSLLGRRRALLDRMRRQMRLRALLEVWLYVHIPLTVALIAALIAHIVSTFYYS